MIVKDGYVLLSSGRRIYAYAGLLAPFTFKGVDSDFGLAYGYDGYAEELDEDLHAVCEPKPLTEEERHEIADYYIARWKRWAEEIPAPPPSECQHPHNPNLECDCGGKLVVRNGAHLICDRCGR